MFASYVRAFESIPYTFACGFLVLDGLNKMCFGIQRKLEYDWTMTVLERGLANGQLCFYN